MEMILLGFIAWFGWGLVIGVIIFLLKEWDI